MKPAYFIAPAKGLRSQPAKSQSIVAAIHEAKTLHPKQPWIITGTEGFIVASATNEKRRANPELLVALSK